MFKTHTKFILKKCITLIIFLTWVLYILCVTTIIIYVFYWLTAIGWTWYKIWKMAARFDISQKPMCCITLNEKFGFSKRLCASSIEEIKRRNKRMRRISLVRIALVVTTKTTLSTSSLQDMRRAFLILYSLLPMRVDDHPAGQIISSENIQIDKK